MDYTADPVHGFNAVVSKTGPNFHAAPAPPRQQIQPVYYPKPVPVPVEVPVEVPEYYAQPIYPSAAPFCKFIFVLYGCYKGHRNQVFFIENRLINSTLKRQQKGLQALTFLTYFCWEEVVQQAPQKLPRGACCTKLIKDFLWKKI